MPKMKFITILPVIFLLGCHHKENTSNHDKTIVQKDTFQKERIDKGIDQPTEGITKNWHPEPLVFICHDYNFEKGYYGLSIHEMHAGNTVPEKKIDFYPYSGALLQGKYNSSGAYYPVQFNSSLSTFYFSLYKGDEMEGTLDWNKIIEYDVVTDSIREIASFSDYVISWFFAEWNNKIYGFENTKRSFISIALNTLEIDTLYTFKKPFEDIEYHVREDSILETILFSKDTGVLKLSINLNTDEAKQEKLYDMADFSSYKNGQVIEMYNDFRGIEGIKIHSKEGTQTKPFNFSNFNTYWINDSQFVVMAENELVLFNTALESIATYHKENIHVIDCLENSLFISYSENGIKKAGFLSQDLKNLKPLDGFDPSVIVHMKSKAIRP